MTNEVIGMNYIEDNLSSNSIIIDGKFSRAVSEYLLRDNIPENGIENIIQNAAMILNYCPKPKERKVSQTTGLVIGKVQSGKTSNFISLTALAFDNGYNLIVILGGTKKLLVKQNRERICEYFRNMEEEVFIFDTTDYRDLLTEEKINQFIKAGKKIVVVALKNPSQINFMRESLFNKTSLSEEPVLIIDDEGDEASLNTLVRKNKKSETYLAIEKLKNSLSIHCYISVTATPQANLLISALDVLSPEFGVLVDPGSGYCGLDVFHGSEVQYVISIDEAELSLLDEGIPSSFKKALAMFFIGSAVRKIRGMKNGEKFSMLIHPSQKKIDHQKVFDKVNNLMQIWRQNATNKKDISYKMLGEELLKAYKQYQSDGVDLPPFSQVEEASLSIINCEYGLHKINGDQVTNNADKFYYFNIYIGGDMLGRGLTLGGLAITYIIRTAKGISAVDTIQQRARWFGYKTKYLDLCRIFAAGKILKEFSRIRDHENDLWETVRTANLEGIKFKEMERIFLLSDTLKMTRDSVAKTKNFLFSYWNFQRIFQDNSDYILNNESIIQSYRAANEKLIQTFSYGDGRPYKVIQDKSFEEVKEEILDRFIFPDESVLNRSLISKLLDLLKRKGIDPRIDIIWMRDGSPGLYAVVDGKINEYMVGRSSVDKSKPAKYKGDRYMFVKENVMQLQIHNIQKAGSDICSPTLALYVPKAYVNLITNLVTRK